MDTPYCFYKHGKEIVEHYLLEYRLYVEQRKKLRKNIRAERMKVEKLFKSIELAKHIKEFIALMKNL